MQMERFDALKRAMFDIGITGMTAANVMGCGEQRGKTEGYFRGAKVEATMLPIIRSLSWSARYPSPKWSTPPGRYSIPA